MPLVLLQRSRTHFMNVREKCKRFLRVFAMPGKTRLARLQAGRFFMGLWHCAVAEPACP